MMRMFSPSGCGMSIRYEDKHIGASFLCELIVIPYSRVQDYIFWSRFLSIVSGRWWIVIFCCCSCEFSLFPLPLLNMVESLYLWGLVPLELYCNLGHHLLGLGDKLPFLPLLLTSIYCAVGIVYSWVKFYVTTLQDNVIGAIKTDWAVCVYVCVCVCVRACVCGGEGAAGMHMFLYVLYVHRGEDVDLIYVTSVCCAMNVRRCGTHGDAAVTPNYSRYNYIL